MAATSAVTGGGASAPSASVTSIGHQLHAENTILRDTITRRLASVHGVEGLAASAANANGAAANNFAAASASSSSSSQGAGIGETFDVRFGEFDDVYYHLVSSAKTPGELILSMALPPSGSGSAPGAKHPDTERVVMEAFEQTKGSVKIAAQSERGYTLTLTLFLSEVPVEHSGNFARRVASLRSLVQGIPLRKHFANLACGKSKKGNTEVFLCRKNRPIYIKPMEDSVIVVIPMSFGSENDAAIAVNFLQNFAETRRQSNLNLSNAPTCTYHLKAPLEVQEAAKQGDAPVNGGYMSFSLFARNVGDSPAQCESAAWHLLVFHPFISYHIKCSKANIQSRMRKQADQWLQVLGRAKAKS